MKRKTVAKTEPIVAAEIIEAARRSAGLDQTGRRATCEVCGSDVAPNSAEQLCWVCRRLKISAWRDSDLQASASE